jgi:HAD superfamily hydrolase (TIGR01662 family)
MVKRALRAVFFDVGETLVDERRYWRAVAELAGVPEHALLAALGVTISRCEEHVELFRHLGVGRPDTVDRVVYERDDLYPDAVSSLERLRAEGYVLGIAGNQTAALERWAREQQLPVDVVGSSAGWGVRKPATEFFERIVREAGCEPSEVAYVGDRVDNDVVPARGAGLVAVHVRRGPWGWLQPGAEQAALRVDTLAELPDALRALGF